MPAVFSKNIFSCFGALLLIISFFLIPAVATADWEQLYPEYPTHGFSDIYVAGSNSAFAVGDFGLIYSYNGSTWTTMASPVSENLNAVWGRSASDVFAVGDHGTIIHYNGSAWQKMSSPTSKDLHSVWGFAGASNPVYAGGRDGNILKYSSGSWSFMQTGLADGIWDTVIIYGIWGYSTGNLYAVGYRSGAEDIFLQCTDGSNWTEITNFPETGFRPTAIWGFAGGLMYIAGDSGIYSLTNGATTWTAVLVDSNGIVDVWGSSASDIWAVSDRIYHFNGISWSTVITSVDPNNYWGGLSAVSGSSASNAFAVGDAGRIYRYQGSAWSSMTTVPEYTVYDLWRDSDTSLCAVGENGLVIHSDGIHWQPMTSGTNEHLYAVCGWGNGHFISAGANGAVQYYNGTTWSQVISGTTEYLNDVWCLAADSAFVVGVNGTILNCNNAGCTAEATDGSTPSLQAVYSSSLGSYATGTGGVLMRKDGTTWNTVTPTSPISNSFIDLWGDPAYGGLVAVGYNDIYSYNIGTNTWTQLYQDPGTLYLQKVIGTSFANLLIAGYGGTFPYSGRIVDNAGSTVKTFANYHAYTIQEGLAGDLFLGGAQKDQNSQWHGQMLHYDGSAWSNMIETSPLTDIWGGDLDSIFVVGSWGTILHYDGTWVTSMESNTLESLTGVYAGDNGNWASATGGAGKMYYFDGSTWAAGFNGSSEWMNDMWGDGDTVYAVGYSGIILQSVDKGAVWNTMTNPSIEHLHAIWGVSASGPIFAAGDNGTVLTYTGGSWTVTPNSALSSIDLDGIWGSSATDVYAVGDSPAILGANESQIIHYDGSSWKESYYGYNVQPAKYLTGVWGSSDKDIIAFGTPNLRKKCGRPWAEMSDGGLPPLVSGWGKEDSNGDYHIFGISGYSSIYHYIIPAGQSCSSPWTLFLPAILAPKK